MNKIDSRLPVRQAGFHGNDSFEGAAGLKYCELFFKNNPAYFRRETLS
jgi:hypothetical protein